MKQKDLILIIIVTFISAVVSFVVSSTVLGTQQKLDTKAEVVEPIVADFPEPDKNYFNEKSINPTQLIRIGESENQTPFNSQ